MSARLKHLHTRRRHDDGSNSKGFYGTITARCRYSMCPGRTSAGIDGVAVNEIIYMTIKGSPVHRLGGERSL